MKHLIDKNALVAEIERRRGYYKRNPLLINAEYCIDEDNAILKFLDTLEVKEMNEEPVSEELEEAIEKSFIYHKNRGDDFRSDKQIETAYKYGFETGAKWADEHSFEKKEED